MTSSSRPFRGGKDSLPATKNDEQAFSLTISFCEVASTLCMQENSRKSKDVD